MQTLGNVTIPRTQDPLRDLENLWAQFDTIFSSLSTRDWSRRHGKDWTVADVPYHLYYFDRELVLAALQRGRDVPHQVRTSAPHNVRELNAWNARNFAQRPLDETPERSVARWREIREQIRERIANIDADELEQPVFVPLMGAGWMTARVALTAGIAHHWNHYTQLRLYLKRSGPIEAASVRHSGLGFYMAFFQLIARTEVIERPFTFTMKFTGAGGGVWSFRIADGRCTASEGSAEGADLVITQSPETFIKTFAKMHNPMLAMLTGQMQIRGFRHMGTFSKLMPPETDEMSLPIDSSEPIIVSAN